MNTVTNLEIAGVTIPDALSPRFDQALIGYLVRFDVPNGVAAYGQTLVYNLTLGGLIPRTDAPYRIVLPAPSFKQFTQHLEQGMQVWEGLNGAIIGTVSAKEDSIPVYHYELAIRILQESFVDSVETDLAQAIRQYFDEQIMKADYGPNTPYILCGSDYMPSDQNGLGGTSVLKLPTGKRGLSVYIEKQRNAQSRNSDTPATPEGQGGKPPDVS